MAKPLQILVLLRNLALGVMAPVLSLTLLAHGATLGTLSLLMAVYSATVIAVEFPSGVFADLAGRKNAFLLSTVLQVVSYALLLLARTAPVLALAMVANGLGRAFASGSIDALAIDQAGEAALAKVTARLSMLESIGLALGALLGGVLAGVGERYTANLTCNLGLYALLFGITLLAVREAPGTACGTVPRRERLPAQVRYSVALMRRRGLPRVLFGLALATGFALLAVETYWQPALEAFRPPAWSFGVVSFGSFFCVAVGSHLAERLLRRREGAGAVWLLLLKALLGGLLCLLAVPGQAGGFIALYGLLYGAVGCGGVVENTLLNRITPSAQRASVLSLLSLTVQIGGLAASLCGYGIRAYGGYATLWRIAGGLLLAGAGAAFLYRRSKVSGRDEAAV